MFVRLSRLLALALAVMAGVGCQSIANVGSTMANGVSSVTGWAPTFLGPYRPDVHQGNIITKEMVEQLRQGMTRDQVRFMLGTPLLTSEFHKERWDYPYYLNPRTGPVQIRRLTLHFRDNKLDRFYSDEMPPEALADVLILGPDARKPPKAPPRQPDSKPETQPPPPTRE